MLSPRNFLDAPAVPAARPTPAARGQARRLVLLEGPVGATLARLALPNIAVVAAQTLVTFADAWYVGRLGVAGLAALALVFPVQAMMSMMSAGAMGGGISAAVARALGAGDRERAEALVIHALLIGLGMAAGFTLLFGVLAQPFFVLLGGRGAALEGAVAYAHILFGGAALVWLANTLASILRGTGNTAAPGLILTVTQLCGVALSGALTFGWGGLPALGIRGPATAFITSFGFAAIAMLVYIHFRGDLRIRFRGIRLAAALFMDILRVGAVACGNALLTIATIIVVTGLVGRYGMEALAGYGIGSRLEIMLIPIAFGVGGAMTAMVGTNRGAGAHARARRIAWTGSLFVFAVTGAIGFAAAIWPLLWTGFFTSDPTALAAAHTYLRIVGPGYGFFGLGMALYFASQGTGNMTWPFISGVLRLLVAAGIGAVLALGLGMDVETLFACVTAGLVCFGGVIAWSLGWSRVWNPEQAESRRDA